MNSAQNCRCPEPTCAPEEASLRAELEEINKRLSNLADVLHGTWLQFRSPETKDTNAEVEPFDIDALLCAIRYRLGVAETAACVLRKRIGG